jgi:hypothetical protein
MGIALHRAPMGNLEGGSFTGNFERYVSKTLVMSSFLHRGPDGEPGGGGRFFAGVSERQVGEGSGNGVSVSVGL